MPIVRTFMCPDCAHQLRVTLTMEQWDEPPPECPRCTTRPMDIDFRPIAIGGSTRARAIKLAEDIAEKDYHVADMNVDNREGGKPKVRYKDQNRVTPHQWGVAQEALQTAIALGRQTRQQHGGDGLDMLQRALKEGVQPDLIEQSKKRAMKIW
jgi:hypothetical protein